MTSNDAYITINNDSEYLLSSDSKNDWTTFLGDTIVPPQPQRPPPPPHESIQTSKQSPGDAINWSIYKVPRRLREVNEKAYEPNVVSIGPYHHGKEYLKAMEVIKGSCFAKIFEEHKLEMKDFIRAIEPLKEQAGKCYQEIPYLHGTAFVEKMAYDGCFIVQLIRGIYPEEDFFKIARTQTDIRYDLLLLENQLPFFVLFELYSMIVPNGEDLDGFARSALSLFNKEPWFRSENCLSPKKDIKHLLDLVHYCCRPSPEGIRQHNAFKAKVEAEAKAKAKQPKFQRSWKFIRSAKELEEAGINFGVQDQDQGSARLFDIEFTEDTKELKIPTLFVDDNTERILRNFMAYEQFIPSGEPTYVSDYVVFMDNLINTGKDVQLLCNSGIIDNCLGDDEAVAQMFNKLRDSIYRSEDFFYAEIFCRVNEHCQRKWDKYKAMLKRDYFNSPWSFISFLAAVVLLLLTLLQTIYSVLSYINRKD